MLRFQVEGMSCDHCRATVTAAIRKLAPAARVDVDLEAGRVEVDPASGAPDRASIVAAIRAAGYETA
jgi:copper chaperone